MRGIHSPNLTPLRLLLYAACVAAACAVLAWPGSAASYTRPWVHPVPPATRYCGPGGDPAAPGNGADPRGAQVGSRNPLAGLQLYVNPILDEAYSDLTAYERRGQTAEAELMARIALQPRAVWFGKFTRPNFFAKVRNFCNPRYRGLGPRPTTDTGFGKVDAFLWLNRPGVSGAGGCNGAPRRAGTWWPERALMFARYATDWIRPPRGTRLGFWNRISLCRLGAPLRNGRYSGVAPERRCGR